MSIVFYSHAVSNYCAKVEITLLYKNLKYRSLPPPDGYGSKAYKAIVAAGTIPAIVDGGLVLSESETINEYLEEAYPDPPLLPKDVTQRARARLIARFHDTRLEPPLRSLFSQMSPDQRDWAFIDQRLLEFQTRLADLGSLCAPAPYICGTQLSFADTAYAATWVMAEQMLEALERPLKLNPELQAWREAVEAVPAVQAVLERSCAATKSWLRAKAAI